MNLDPKIDDVRGRLLETKVVGTSGSVIKNNVQVVRRSTACFAAKSTRALDSADKLSWVLLEEVQLRIWLLRLPWPIALASSQGEPNG
jgi:hypothetical protein